VSEPRTPFDNVNDDTEGVDVNCKEFAVTRCLILKERKRGGGTLGGTANRFTESSDNLETPSIKGDVVDVDVKLVVKIL